MKNKKVTYFLCGMFALLTIGGIGACIGSSVVLMDQSNEQFSKVNQFIDDERARQAKEAEQSNPYQEDGYKVMEQYEIRSTRQISDAFLNKDPSKLQGEDKETYDMAKAVYDKIIKDDMNGYEKELAIYNWMVENIRQSSGYAIIMPGQNTQAYTPHDVLKRRRAVCVGYATTFRLLANMAGLEVHIVHNEVEHDLATIEDLSYDNFTAEGRIEWADVLAARVEQIYEGSYGLQIQCSNVECERLEEFSKALAGYCPAEDWDKWFNNESEQEQNMKM